MTPQDAYQSLTTNPEYFLKYYPISIAGHSGAHAANASTTPMMHLYKKNPAIGTGANATGPVGHYGATRPGRVLGGLRTHNISSFRMGTSPDVGSVGFQACSIPMVNYNSAVGGRVNLAGNLAGMPNYLFDNNTQVMITGQLSGCCFAWREHGGTLHGVHVQPIGGISSTALHNSISTTGTLAVAGGPLSTFGRNDYDAFATIIGVQIGGNWRIYAQNSPDRGATVSRTRRIHPGAVTDL